MRSDIVKRGATRCAHRSLFHANGYGPEDLRKPLIGICNSFNEIIPGHIHLREIAEAAKLGVAAAGGTPVEFPAIGVCDGIAMGHTGMKYSLASRELIADSVESVAMASGFDGLVLIPNCDKVVPGMLMAAARLNIPCVVVSGGPMLPGRFHGRDVSVSQAFEAAGKFAAGEMAAEEMEELEAKCCPGCGSCAGLFTANTMNSLSEVLGMALPGNGTIPAAYTGARRLLAKRAGAVIMDLIEKGVTKIFYPCEPYNMVDEQHPSENHYNCPIVASYAENIRGNMDVLREKHITFLQPFLPINDEKRMAERLAEELKGEYLTREEIEAATAAAYEELAHYRQDVRDYGARILERLERTGEQAILLVGRPYHIDPEINHGIPEMIQSYHLPILSEDAVYHLPVKGARLSIVNQWSYHARLYHAAQVACEHPNLTLIQFSSFGCGLDAITTGQVRDILEAHQRIYTMIKLDEVSNLGAARIRLRSLMAALARRKPVAYHDVPVIERPHFTAECKKTHTILAPQMAPIHFELIQAVMRDYGYAVVVPPMPDKAAIDLGLRYVNNDMCYPSIVVIGQLLAALKSGKYDPDHTSIAMFQTCGACRATNYMSVLRQALRYAGFGQVPVFAVHGLPEETDAFHLTRQMLISAVKAAIFGDILQNVRNRMLPYELQKGETQRLFDKWMARCKEVLKDGGYFLYQRTVKQMIKEFDHIPIDEHLWKPKVGIVGEILAKYHPVANNHIERELLQEGAEVVMPDFVDFFLYSAYDPIVKHQLLDGSKKASFFGRMFINIINFYRAPMRKAMKASRHFRAPHKIDETARLAGRHVSLGNMAGEGWFLTGEMVKLIDEGVPNVVCLQPFGCLPNHITGKGVMHELRTSYKGANITAIDCDAGSSEVNQLNRLKLMLAVAKERGPQGDFVTYEPEAAAGRR